MRLLLALTAGVGAAAVAIARFFFFPLTIRRSGKCGRLSRLNKRGNTTNTASQVLGQACRARIGRSENQTSQ
jgi:hypothetical protein